MRLQLALLVSLASAAPAHAADWPTYRGDIARSGSTHESLETPLTLQWEAVAPAAPKLAWSSGEGRVMENHVLGARVKFDDAFQPVVVGNRVFYGSTVDHQLHCLDLASGEQVWSFFTGGPIRLAPTVADGRVYIGSDDGRMYCLDANSGEQHWQVRPGPEEDWLLARGEMISRWPVRTGVLVDNGIAYFGAGIFPHEDVYIYAVDAATGKLVWKADTISERDAGRNDLSPQGYLLASDERLFVPSGRSLPAAFDRATGRFLFKRTHSWRTTAGGVVGGTRALLADGQIYASGPHHLLAMTQNAGDVGFGWFTGRQMVVQDDAAYVATGTYVARLDRLAYAENSRRRHELEMDVYSLAQKLRSADNPDEIRAKLEAAQQELKDIADGGIVWKQETEDDAELLAAGNLAFLGGEKRVTAYAADGGEPVWQAEVDGAARGLVVANEHLLVSTDTGGIYCFAAGGPQQADIRRSPGITGGNPYAEDDLTETYAQTARDILKDSGVTRGFCLVVGGEEGRLAYELAKHSELKIYCVEPDAEKAARARQALSQAGLYGHRVIVHNVPFDAIPYSDYFANLIVSDTFAKTGEFPCPPLLIAHHLKPLGGVLILASHPEGTRRQPTDSAHLATLLEQTRLTDESHATTTANNALLTRDALPGAGDWSHEYGNPSNTAIGDDERVNGDLGVLWYGDPGPGEMVNRHEGAVGPLCVNGRLFVQGESTIKAYDAYNGVWLWTWDNPDAIRTGVFQNQNPANVAATDDRLFTFLGDICYELDAGSGVVLAAHHLPPGADEGRHQWGYLAVQDGLLIGTATIRGELTASERRRGRVTNDSTDVLFAIDLASGKHLWQYHGQSISHHTVALGPDRVFFIDSSITSEQREEILRQDKTELANLTGEAREFAEERAKNIDVRMAIALEASTGEKLWEHPVDVTDCSDVGTGGGKLTLMYADGTLMLCGANANGHYWRQFVSGEFKRRRLVALSSDDGYKLWAKDANYRHRPIIIGDHVLAEPWMFDLKTGDQLTREHPITGEQVPWTLMRTGHHCGMLTGCDSGMLMFRSGDTGFFDLDRDEGVRHFAGHRLGCWINAIPAAGLVLIPEASAGCVCQFSIASTIVLEPRDPKEPWTIFSAVGSDTPVRHMAINFGAPGDRKAADGTVWLSYPRYRAYQETSLDVKLDFDEQFAGGGGFRFVNDLTTPVQDTDIPWLYTSWAQNLTKFTLPLLGENDPPATYRIRLHFADTREEEHSPSVFDVLINGRTIQEGVRVERAADAPAVAQIVESGGIEVSDSVTIELRPTSGLPVLCAVEAIAE